MNSVMIAADDGGWAVDYKVQSARPS